MRDLIYRDKAIDAVIKAAEKNKNEVDALIDLPAVEAVPKKSYLKLKRQFVQLGYLLAEKLQAEKNRGEEMAEVVPVREVKLREFKVDEIPDDWGPKILGKDKRPRKKIYIAGPVTGVEGYEETFANAADDLRARGYEPVNPVAPGIVEGWTYRDYINRGFQMLIECDGILLLPGYMDSKGAALELHYALAVGMELIRGFDHADDQERDQ